MGFLDGLQVLSTDKGGEFYGQLRYLSKVKIIHSLQKKRKTK